MSKPAACSCTRAHLDDVCVSSACVGHVFSGKQQRHRRLYLQIDFQAVLGSQEHVCVWRVQVSVVWDQLYRVGLVSGCRCVERRHKGDGYASRCPAVLHPCDSQTVEEELLPDGDPLYAAQGSMSCAACCCLLPGSTGPRPQGQSVPNSRLPGTTDPCTSRPNQASRQIQGVLDRCASTSRVGKVHSRVRRRRVVNDPTPQRGGP